MPIYTYYCEKCGTKFEAFASIQKKETGWQPNCPKCGSPNPRQTFNLVATLAKTPRSSSGRSCCSS